MFPFEIYFSTYLSVLCNLHVQSCNSAQSSTTVFIVTLYRNVKPLSVILRRKAAMFYLVEPHSSLHLFWMLISVFVSCIHPVLLYLLSCRVIYSTKSILQTVNHNKYLFISLRNSHSSCSRSGENRIRSMRYLSSSTVSIGCTRSVFTSLIWSANRMADSNRSMPASFPKSTRASLSRCSINSILISVFYFNELHFA